MRNRMNHLTALSKRPARAQTVQQLKFDTQLVYIQNAFIFAQSGLLAGAYVADLFGDLGNSIPYKNFYGNGGAGSGGGGGT